MLSLLSSTMWNCDSSVCYTYGANDRSLWQGALSCTMAVQCSRCKLKEGSCQLSKNGHCQLSIIIRYLEGPLIIFISNLLNNAFLLKAPRLLPAG